ncbi:MAG: TolC family protein [Bacteroidales bacterium]
MHKSSILSILLFLVPAMGLFAQTEPWTLEQCIRHALDNNIQIKQQELNTQYQENAFEQSRYDLLPNLNASASHNYSFGRALDETTYGFIESTERIQTNNFQAGSGVTLFNGLQKINTIKQNRYNLLASREDLEKMKNDISLNIALAYLQILFNEELMEVARNQLEVTRLQVERTRKLVEAGSLPHGSLLEIQAQEAAEELQLVNSQNQYDISLLNLAQLLELDSVGDFTIARPELDVPDEDQLSLSVRDIYARAEAILPQVKSAEYSLMGSQTSLKIARGARSPSLSMNLFSSTGYSDARERMVTDETGMPVIDPVTNLPTYEPYPFWDQMDDNITYGFGFSLSIPIFNQMRTQTGIKNARIQVMNARLALENTKKQLYKEIQQKYADALAALKKYNASLKTLSSMQESFRYTEQKFNVGLVTSVEYNTAKNQLTRTESDLLQAKYEYIFQLKVLEFYTGEPLEL